MSYPLPSPLPPHYNQSNEKLPRLLVDFCHCVHGGIIGADASINVEVGYSDADTWSDTEGTDYYVNTGGGIIYGAGVSTSFNEDGEYNGAGVNVGVGHTTPAYVSMGVENTNVVVDRNLAQDVQNIGQDITNTIESGIDMAARAGEKIMNFFTGDK